MIYQDFKKITNKQFQAERNRFCIRIESLLFFDWEINPLHTSISRKKVKKKISFYSLR